MKEGSRWHEAGTTTLRDDRGERLCVVLGVEKVLQDGTNLAAVFHTQFLFPFVLNDKVLAEKRTSHVFSNVVVVVTNTTRRGIQRNGGNKRNTVRIHAHVGRRGVPLLPTGEACLLFSRISRHRMRVRRLPGFPKSPGWKRGRATLRSVGMARCLHPTSDHCS